MQWLTVTHTQRWHAAHRTAGTGPLFQGCFKSFPIEEDGHLLTVLRYVERNPLRANMVEEAAAWRWSSLWHRVHGSGSGLLDAGPVAIPRGWRQYVETPQTEAELEALRRSVVGGAPFGSASWQEGTARRLGLQSTLARAVGRGNRNSSRNEPKQRLPTPLFRRNKDSRPLCFFLCFFLLCFAFVSTPLFQYVGCHRVTILRTGRHDPQFGAAPERADKRPKSRPSATSATPAEKTVPAAFRLVPATQESRGLRPQEARCAPPPRKNAKLRRRASLQLDGAGRFATGRGRRNFSGEPMAGAQVSSPS